KGSAHQRHATPPPSRLIERTDGRAIRPSYTTDSGSSGRGVVRQFAESDASISLNGNGAAEAAPYWPQIYRGGRPLCSQQSEKCGRAQRQARHNQREPNRGAIYKCVPLRSHDHSPSQFRCSLTLTEQLADCYQAASLFYT